MAFSLALRSVLVQLPAATWAPSVPQAASREDPPSAAAESPAPRRKLRRENPGSEQS